MPPIGSAAAKTLSVPATIFATGAGIRRRVAAELFLSTAAVTLRLADGSPIADDAIVESFCINGQPKPIFADVSPPIQRLPSATTSAPQGRGLTGLDNIGNTCFLNSAVQVLSHTPGFREYFVDDSWLREVNRDNPLGMGGEIVEKFGLLLRKLWMGDTVSIAPVLLLVSNLTSADEAQGHYWPLCGAVQ